MEEREHFAKHRKPGCQRCLGGFNAAIGVRPPRRAPPTKLPVPVVVRVPQPA
jgi:hypothetical protein